MQHRQEIEDEIMGYEKFTTDMTFENIFMGKSTIMAKKVDN